MGVLSYASTLIEEQVETTNCKYYPIFVLALKAAWFTLFIAIFIHAKVLPLAL